MSSSKKKRNIPAASSQPVSQPVKPGRQPAPWQGWLPFVIVLLVGVVLSLKTLQEPDIWWQLRTGEYIMSTGSVPDTDVFTFTCAGDPWTNVKWGFEVLMALASRLGGPEMIYLLQVVATIILLLYGYNSWRQLAGRKDYTPSAGFIIAALFMLFTISYRLNGRPEMVSHMLSAIYLYLFIRTRQQQDWRLYLLIPLQMLWANLHEGYGVGLVMLAIFSFSAIAEWMLHSRLKLQIVKRFPVKILVVSVLAWLSTAIHPSGFKMLTYFVNIFSQLESNQFTAELHNIFSEYYWTYQAYMNIGLLLTCCIFISLWLNTKDTNRKAVDIIRRFGMFYILLLIAFFYLSTSAFRNIPFFFIAAIPFIAALADDVFSARSWYTSARTSIALSVVAVVFYISVVTGVFYEEFTPRHKYGLGIDPRKTPIGAANFIEANHLKGKAFSDYLSSSYLLWRLQPEFKTYIDLRDLDVFSQKFMDNVLYTYVEPARWVSEKQRLWDYLEDYDHFEYVALLNNPQFVNLHRHLLHADNEFDLVYADPLMSVYVKVNGTHKAVVEKYGYKTARNKGIFHPHTVPAPGAAANVVNHIFFPFYQPEDVRTGTKTLEQKYKSLMGL